MSAAMRRAVALSKNPGRQRQRTVRPPSSSTPPRQAFAYQPCASLPVSQRKFPIPVEYSYAIIMSKCILDELTDEQIEEFRAAFDLFDKDGNGSISKEELGQVMKNLGLCPSDEDLRDMIREHDIDQSGQIEFEEFCRLMFEQVNCAGADRDETLLAAFRTFDRDGSGKISADELRQMMHTLGERLTDDEIEDMIREADEDGDGQIDYREFVQMMESKN